MVTMGHFLFLYNISRNFPFVWFMFQFFHVTEIFNSLWTRSFCRFSIWREFIFSSFQVWITMNALMQMDSSQGLNGRFHFKHEFPWLEKENLELPVFSNLSLQLTLVSVGCLMGPVQFIYEYYLICFKYFLKN